MSMSTIRHSVVTLIAAVCFASISATSTAQTADPFNELREQFSILSLSLTNQRGIAERDKPVIIAFRDKAVAFAAAHPADDRPWALIAQLSMWLDDNASLDLAYDKLLTLRPQDSQLAALVARRLMERSRYEQALIRLEPFAEEFQHDSRNAQLLAQCYFALNQFKDALDLLAALDLSDPAERVRYDTFIQPDIDKYTRYVSYWDAELQLRQAEAERNDLPRVELITTDGSIVFELFEDSVPNTVANFISLIESGFYDGLRIHRVIPDYMTQAGDPREREGATVTVDNPGYFIAEENLGTDKQRRHFRGSIAMASKDRPNSVGGEFYITHKPVDFLDGRRVVFGRVIQGIDIACSLKEREDLILTARVLRKRNHPYLPEIAELLDSATTDTPSGSIPSMTNDDSDGLDDSE